MQVRKVPASAIHKYKKNYASIASAYTAELETNQKYLCIQFIPKPGLMQQVKRVWGWLAWA
ncbi:hypothetical protein [Lactiplantibacillus xiangfangensis]|uniref:hypothetical protein n=1 Tax=Lactiplantibacillus xiangfangensis TaxID=942150 RepID=UPI00384FF82E